jgi:hypothetical protein
MDARVKPGHDELHRGRRAGRDRLRRPLARPAEKLAKKRELIGEIITFFDL